MGRITLKENISNNFYTLDIEAGIFNKKKQREDKLSEKEISLKISPRLHIEVGIFRIASWTGINLGSCIWKWKMPLHHPDHSFQIKFTLNMLQDVDTSLDPLKTFFWGSMQHPGKWTTTTTDRLGPAQNALI